MDERIERRFHNVNRSKTFKNIVNTFSLHEKQVLDIGCSYGEHLAHFGKKSVGLTTIAREVAYGVSRKLDIRSVDIEHAEGVELGTFDAIFCNNLLEHLYAPHTFLEKLKTLLRPGGVLILGVPCIPKFSFLLRFKKFRGSLAESHINFFMRETLAKTVERSGWSVRMVRGFHFKSRLLDMLFQPVYPHFYVVARVN